MWHRKKWKNLFGKYLWIIYTDWWKDKNFKIKTKGHFLWISTKRYLSQYCFSKPQHLNFIFPRCWALPQFNGHHVAGAVRCTSCRCHWAALTSNCCQQGGGNIHHVRGGEKREQISLVGLWLETDLVKEHGPPPPPIVNTSHLLNTWESMLNRRWPSPEQHPTWHQSGLRTWGGIPLVFISTSLSQQRAEQQLVLWLQNKCIVPVAQVADDKTRFGEKTKHLGLHSSLIVRKTTKRLPPATNYLQFHGENWCNKATNNWQTLAPGKLLFRLQMKHISHSPFIFLSSFLFKPLDNPFEKCSDQNRLDFFWWPKKEPD